LYFSALSSYWATLLPLRHGWTCASIARRCHVGHASKKTKASEVTGISTTDYQYVPEEFGDHHGKHDVWVAEIPFIGLKTFTCDTSGYLCCCKSM
jgi:hypothetical protein